MKIGEIRAGMRKIDVTGTVEAVSTVRDVQTKRGPGQVADATLKDETGTIALTLWNEGIAKVHVGAKVSIENAMASSYKGKLQLSLGMYGKLSTA